MTEYTSYKRQVTENSEVYAPHFAQHSVQIDGYIGENQPLAHSSLNAGHQFNANSSNVQVVCKINTPLKTEATQGHKVSRNRSVSAHRKNPSFSSGQTLLSHRPAQRRNHDSTNPNTHRSYASVASTPATGRSPSYERNAVCENHPSRRSKLRYASGGRKSSVSPQNSQLYFQHSESQSSAKKLLKPQMLQFNRFHEDAKYSVFSSIERSNKVIISENPIAGRIINEQLRDVRDIDNFLQACNTNGYENQTYEFDNVFSEMQKQDKFYSQCVKPVVNSFVEGENGTVVLFGPSQSGKTYALHGKAGRDRGIVPRAIEDILAISKNTFESDNNQSSVIEDFGTETNPILSVNAPNRFKIHQDISNRADPDMASIDRLYLKISIYMVYCDKIYDLLATLPGQKVKIDHYIDPNSQQVVSKFSNMSEKVVLTLEHYYAIVQDAFKQRRALSIKLTDHDIRKRSHLVLGLTLVKQSQSGAMREISKLNFTELCGSEQSVATGGQIRDTTVRQFVTKSFNCLSTQILKSALGKRTQFEEGDSGLAAALKSTMTQHSNIILIACASPSQHFYDHSLPAVKFCARIRDTILRKLQKQSFMRQQQVEQMNSQAQGIQRQQAVDSTNSKQTRFKLEQDHSKMSTFGRKTIETNSQSPIRSNLKKVDANQLESIRPEDVSNIIRQVQAEVQKYDAMTRESSHGNKVALAMEEVREWSMRKLETLNRALYVVKGTDDRENRGQYNDIVDSLHYLKQRVCEIEKQAMQISSARGISPPTPSEFRTDRREGNLQGASGSIKPYADSGTKGHTREDPFNKLVTVGNESHRDRYDKIEREERDRFRTYEPSEERENLQRDPHQRPYSSQYGPGELQERNFTESHAENYARVPQSARDGHYSHQHSLRNFNEKSKSRERPESECGQSPGFISGTRGRDRLGDTGYKSGPGTFDEGYEPVGLERRHQDLPRQYTGSLRSKSRESTRERDRHSSTKVTTYESNFKRVTSVPDVQEMKEKFISSQRVQSIIRSTFGDIGGPSMLYKSAEEALTDMQRLIMLEDFEGLRRRVMQMYKERQTSEQLLATKEIEINELREQVNIREESVRQIETLNQRNLEQYLKEMQEIKATKNHTETQSSFRIQALQDTIEQQTEQLEELKQEKELERARLEQMTQEVETHKRSRFEAEAKQQTLAEENKKLYTNYDVLKEHELNIIKDFQDRKIHEQSTLDQQIADLKRQIDEKNEKLNDTRRQVFDLEGEVRKAEFETKKVLDQKSMIGEQQSVIQSRLDKEKEDNKDLREKITVLEAELDSEQQKCRNEIKEKQLAYDEIKQLQDLVSAMEQEIKKLQEQNKDLISQKDERGTQIDQMEQQKRVFEERISLKQKEINATQVQVQEQQEKFDALQSQYDKLDREMIKLKAKEFDKVDLLQQNAELEGRNKNLSIEVEHLLKAKNQSETTGSTMFNENEKLKDQVRVLETELEYYRRSHEMQLDKFDKKFTEFQTELTNLTDQNYHLREKEKKNKRKIHDLEVQNLEWKEKYKYQNVRNGDLTSQVENVERDMQKLANEAGKQAAFVTIQGEKSQRKEEATEQAFVDIKSMISQYRKDRITQKENKEANRVDLLQSSQRSPQKDDLYPSNFGDTNPVISGMSWAKPGSPRKNERSPASKKTFNR